ncbi:MAG: hypothetical protein KI785_05430 [Devosiaceae bacterium]|nr:hypothetical protein [Devosiaceae bacterium MH13]
MAKQTGLKNTVVSIAVTAANGNVPEAQNDDLTQTAFEALDWVEVSSIGKLTDFGGQTTMNTYDELNTSVSQKNKGVTDAGTLTLECREVVTDNGQIAMKAAGAVSFTDSVAVKVEYDDQPSGGTSNTIRYSRGLVGAPTFMGGGVNDFQRVQFQVGLVQEILEVAAA